MARNATQNMEKTPDEVKQHPLSVKISEIRSNQAELIGMEEKGQHVLYQMIAKCVGFIKLTNSSQEGRNVFEQLCKEQEINPRDNALLSRNEFLPHFRLLFRISKEDKLTPAMYKWCQATRILFEENVDEKDVVEFISNYSYKGKNKLAGLVAYDSATHKTNRGRPAGVEDKLYKIRKKTEDLEIAVIETEQTPKTTEKLCLVLGEVDKTGKIVLRQFYEGEDLDKMVVKFLPKKK